MKIKMNNNRHTYSKRFFSLLLFTIAVFISCKSEDSPVEPIPQSRGDIVSTSFIASYSTQDLRLLLLFAAGSQQIN